MDTVQLLIAGPIDVDIREDFPHDVLVEVIRDFGRGGLGFNILTLSCANAETLNKAIEYPGARRHPT